MGISEFEFQAIVDSDSNFCRPLHGLE